MRFAHSLKKYLILAAFLFGLIALPTLFIEKLRIKVMGIICPLSTGPISKAKAAVSKTSSKDVRVKSLEIENQHLRNELAKCKVIANYGTEKAIPVNVIYRDPASWASSFWIDAGETMNKKAGKKIISKNSPVLYGNGVVGVVDYVGNHQSRVRLLTDSGLKISVRATRGMAKAAMIVEQVDSLQKTIISQKDLPILKEELTLLYKKLDLIKSHYQESQMTWYLAKGLIQGSGAPLWRKKTILKGSGFNYDFSDEQGPARDLHLGTAVGANQDSFPPIPLIQINDLLVTTGMDGVFPPGFKVGIVTKIYPLEEGAYTYDIEASPVVAHIDELKTVFVLPSLAFEQN